MLARVTIMWYINKFPSPVNNTKYSNVYFFIGQIYIYTHVTRTYWKEKMRIQRSPKLVEFLNRNKKIDTHRVSSNMVSSDAKISDFSHKLTLKMEQVALNSHASERNGEKRSAVHLNFLFKRRYSCALWNFSLHTFEKKRKSVDRIALAQRYILGGVPCGAYNIEIYNTLSRILYIFRSRAPMEHTLRSSLATA